LIIECLIKWLPRESIEETEPELRKNKKCIFIKVVADKEYVPSVSLTTMNKKKRL
jgi:hypothetical protein